MVWTTATVQVTGPPRLHNSPVQAGRPSFCVMTWRTGLCPRWE
ncbi:hypothetical protein RSPPQCQH_CDS0045 [Mycolicibacterium phage phi1_186001]